ncbi:MAG: sulfatase [Lysobacterales bacterium]
MLSHRVPNCSATRVTRLALLIGMLARLLIGALVASAWPGLAVSATVDPAASEAGSQTDAGGALPDIVLISVDTLRADRLSAYGNPAPTSPHIDALLSAGARFNTARTVEPLTGPASASMLTSLYPHEHGSSRNGIPIRQGLRSLPQMLMHLGYVTVAFVSNWTLADEQSGLAEHFDVYQGVFTKKRWLFWFGESDAEDVLSGAITWLEDEGAYPGQPLFLWVHFVEPHAPYKLHKAFAERLGIPPDGRASVMQRYDTEIAAVDDAIGRLLQDLERHVDPANTLFIFTSDHGEALGEYGYKGHGRHLFEEELRIPLGFTWRNRIPPASLEVPTSLVDLAPTVLGLLGAPRPPEWQGQDWSAALLSGTDGPADRPVYFQAHKGVALGASGNAEVADNKRRRGLLKLGLVQGNQKLVLDLDTDALHVFDLPAGGAGGPLDYAGVESSPRTTGSPADAPPLLRQWQAAVEQGLTERDRSPPPKLSEEAIEKLRSLGYTN